MPDPLDPQFDLSKPTNDSGSFAVKRIADGPFLSTTLSIRKQAWEDALEFLRSIRKPLFDQPELPESMSERLLFTPQIGKPITKSAGLISLGLSEESKSGLRDNFLFIEDIYHFIWQIWRFSLDEETKLEEKRLRALKNARETESEEQKAWEAREKVISALKEYLLKDVEEFARKL